MKDQLETINLQSQINRRRAEEAHRAEMDRLKYELELARLKAELEKVRNSTRRSKGK